MATRIPEHVLSLLSECEADSAVLKLPPRQLERKDYTDLAKIIECLGGKWDRKAQGMLFPAGVDPAAVIDAAILAGEVVDHQKELGFFETPPRVCEILRTEAKLEPRMSVLEPSAGNGAIARVCRDGGASVTCCEIDPAPPEALLADSERAARFLARLQRTALSLRPAGDGRDRTPRALLTEARELLDEGEAR